MHMNKNKKEQNILSTRPTALPGQAWQKEEEFVAKKGAKKSVEVQEGSI